MEPADRERVEAALARTRLIVAALAGGVLVLAAGSGFVDFGGDGAFGRMLSLPVGLAGLVALVVGWRLFMTMRDRAADVEEVETGIQRYSAALLMALALTEGVAFVGVVAYMLGGTLIALTGVATHVLLTGILWPAGEKIRPFLGHAGQHYTE